MRVNRRAEPVYQLKTSQLASLETNEMKLRSTFPIPSIAIVVEDLGLCDEALVLESLPHGR